jgi:hypothetical protein
VPRHGFESDCRTDKVDSLHRGSGGLNSGRERFHETVESTGSNAMEGLHLVIVVVGH